MSGSPCGQLVTVCMSTRLANAQLRLLQSRALPGLPGADASKKSTRGKKRRRGAAGKKGARKRRRGGGVGGGEGGNRQAPIARKVKESKARTQEIMADLAREQNAREIAEKRTRRTLRALKTRKSDVAKDTLVALLARR